MIKYGFMLFTCLGGVIFTIGSMVYAVISLTRVFHPFDALGTLLMSALCLVVAAAFFAGLREFSKESV